MKVRYVFHILKIVVKHPILCQNLVYDQILNTNSTWWCQCRHLGVHMRFSLVSAGLLEPWGTNGWFICCARKNFIRFGSLLNNCVNNVLKTNMSRSICIRYHILWILSQIPPKSFRIHLNLLPARKNNILWVCVLQLCTCPVKKNLTRTHTSTSTCWYSN